MFEFSVCSAGPSVRAGVLLAHVPPVHYSCHFPAQVPYPITLVLTLNVLPVGHSLEYPSDH